VQVSAPAGGIDRLFVAVPVPADLAGELARLQPPAAAGVRLSQAADMHVTLHFLGNTQADPVRQALAGVRAAAFQMLTTAPGAFALRGQRTILWLGVTALAPLTRLHQQVAVALRPLGFRPERRPYRPHITLARVGPGAAPELLQAYRSRETASAPLKFACSGFALYRSETTAAGPRYRILESYALE
jgi:2'-5' RNA ligase